MNNIINETLNAAVVQMICTPGNIQANIEKAKSFIEKASENHAELIILPELFNTGYDLTLLDKIDYNFKENIDILSKNAKNNNINIAAGILEIHNNIKYNSIVFIDNNGTLKSIYRKNNLFPLSNEHNIFKPGTQLSIVELNGFKIGLIICYDIRFTELTNRYLKEGIDILIICSAFPFPRLNHWQILTQCRAIENQVYALCSNRAGRENNLWFLGNSCIIDPWGIVKQQADSLEETILYHELDLKRINEVRQKIPILTK